MTLLLDTSLWIDFTRARSPESLKRFIAPYVLDPTAHLADPVVFEVLRSAKPHEARLLEAQFATMPCLTSPPQLWSQAATLGQACRQSGLTVASLDLLIAAVALHHNAAVVSFDADFEAIASISALRVQPLRRPD